MVEQSRDPGRLQPVDFDFWWPARPEISWQIVGLRGVEELARPYEFELELICNDAGVDLEALLGADCELLLERSGLSRVVFGVVADVELGVAPSREDDGVSVRVLLVPAFRLLDRDLDTRFFLGQTVVEILRDCLGPALARFGRELDVESRIVGRYNRRDYCVQFRESTFDFCSRIMEEEGIAYVFVPDHDNQRERLVLIDDNAGYAKVELVVPGAVPIVATAPEEIERESIQRLDWRRRRTPSRFVTRGYSEKNPTRFDEGTAERDEAVTLERFVHADQRQIVDDPVDDPEARRFTGAELDQRPAMAARMLERAGIEGVRGRGRANAVGFAAGGVFELDASLDPLAGERALLIVRVEHHGEVSHDAASSHSAYQNRFECVPRSQVFRPAGRTAKPRVHGVQTGVVVGRVADEVHTDALGRVKVRFHGDRSETDGEHRSCWIRVAHGWAGNAYGALLIPRVGMEVVVAFVDGNPDCPLIVGAVYHANNLPPYSLPDELGKSTLKTRSTPGGDGFHELRLDDERGREQLFVHAQRRMDLRVRGLLLETATAGREEVIGSNESRPGVALANSHNVLVHGAASLHVRENRFAQVDLSDYQTVRGELVEDFQDSHYTFVEQLAQLNASDIVLEARDGLSQTATTIEQIASAALNLRAGRGVTIQSNNRIELVVGQSFLALTPTGVEIGGESIRLNSGGGATGRIGDGRKAIAVETCEPIEPLLADDGRPHAGGAGGTSSARRVQRRTLEPKHPPPLEPMKPTRPHGRSTGRRVIIFASWAEPEAWCSETAVLRVESEGYDGSVAETLLIDNEVDGTTQCVDVLRPAAPSEDFRVEITDVIPRRIGDTVESERGLIGSIGGAVTPIAIRMRFVSQLDRIRYAQGRARFDLRVVNHEVVVGGTIEYTRGWIFHVIRLGELVPEGTGGRIGGTHFGSTDWRYCKPEYDDDGDGRYVYWDGERWVDVPEGWTNPMGTNLHGLGVWREAGRVKTQYGALRWPDPVPETWTDLDEGEDAVQWRMDTWAEEIGQFWTGRFDLQRVECRGHDVHCCRYRVRCEVRIEQSDRKRQGIILAQNYGRANASVWPYDVDFETVDHEFGHHLGNPDEYPGATSVDPTVNGDGARAGIDEASIMGGGELVRRRHFDTICAAMSEAVAKRTGKLFSYKAVEPTLGAGE